MRADCHQRSCTAAAIDLREKQFRCLCCRGSRFMFRWATGKDEGAASAALLLPVSGWAPPVCHNLTCCKWSNLLFTRTKYTIKKSLLPSLSTPIMDAFKHSAAADDSQSWKESLCFWASLCAKQTTPSQHHRSTIAASRRGHGRNHVWNEFG